ncbi:helix-turn-helix domain-containing protein [Oceanobacillus halophilus]|uniref:Transposase n=1 Tax=Oceanobacillus halophilus TaxID=930130 RepID=A0A495A4C6_9BACI|nr:helix-turn-helix domain-containing protein [Oceanobacillus halophilus]RKQ34262.1 transposase [Oceanobacillus halophilus]
MAKFTEEDKINAVQSYLEGKESYHSIGRTIGTSSSVVMNWVSQYNLYGIEGLLKKSYTSYSEPFKLDVLNYIDSRSQ